MYEKFKDGQSKYPNELARIITEDCQSGAALDSTQESNPILAALNIQEKIIDRKNLAMTTEMPRSSQPDADAKALIDFKIYKAQKDS